VVIDAGKGVATSSGSIDIGKGTNAPVSITIGQSGMAGNIILQKNVAITPTTNQLILGTTNTTTLSAIAPAASRTLSIQDPLTNCNIVTGSYPMPTAITDTASVATTASGQTHLVTSKGGGAYLVSLPAPANGLKYKFVLQSATNANNIDITATSTIFYGAVTCLSTGLVIAGRNTVRFTNTAVRGDWVAVESDGTNWYVSGASQITTGSITTPS
jgi:hypothetical protein